MSFREPAVLLGLLLIPVALLAYVAMQARRRREAAAFGNPALMPNIVTGRPGWRRHLPAAIFLLAAAVLILALARPQRTVAAPQRAATVVLVQRRVGLDARRGRGSVAARGGAASRPRCSSTRPPTTSAWAS